MNHQQIARVTPPPSVWLNTSAGVPMDISLTPAESQSDRFALTQVLPLGANDQCAELVATLEELFPDWFDEFGPANADLSEWNALADLAQRAPHEFLAGMASGTLSERISISMITGRRPANYSGTYRPVFLTTAVALELQAENTEWFDSAASIEADPCAAIADMKALVARAPHPYFAGLVYGSMTARLEFRRLAGR